LPDAARSSRGPEYRVVIVEEGSEREKTVIASHPVAATSNGCAFYHVAPAVPKERKGFDDFDALALEVSGEPGLQPSLAEGRKWVADSFGNGDLASLRLAAGLSQAEVALRCGVEQPHISRYESGRHEPLVSVAQKLAAALGVTLDDFFVAWSRSRSNHERKTS